MSVRGEVRNLSRAPSGHAYFTIRDEGAQLACVLFRMDAEAVPFPLRDGLSVVVRAQLDFYPGRGLPQLLVRTVRHQGVGDLWLAFEQTRDRLARDGLLDAARKRPIPRFPRRVGLVTSESGAAIHDVLHVLRRRYPLGCVLVSPALVQGAEAPGSLVAAIRQLQDASVDVIVLARGGGAAEDLWAFNDEGLARVIASSAVPVVAAVGHETGVTIAGLVADVRAPTPSAAAEVVAPNVEELERRVRSLGATLVREMRTRLVDARQRLDGFALGLTPAAMAARRSDARHRLVAARTGLLGIARILERHRQSLVSLFARLDALSPRATMRRGYAIALKHGHVLASVGDVGPGDPLLLLVQDGEIACRVTRTTKQ